MDIAMTRARYKGFEIIKVKKGFRVIGTDSIFLTLETATSKIDGLTA